MAVPMRSGQLAQWPVSTVPIESLEAAAREWYRFRDSSCGVKLYNQHWLLIIVAVILMMLLGPGWRLAIARACRLDETDQCHTRDPSTCDQLAGCLFLHDKGGGVCTPEASFSACEDLRDYSGRMEAMAIALPLMMLGLALYVKWQLLPRLRDEASSRLAGPVAQALVGTGWSVKAHSLARHRGTRAPQGLRQGCCSPGWLWLEFAPHDGPVVGAPLAAPLAQPLPASAVVGFVVGDPGIARAPELSEPPEARLRPLLAA
ncbi:unnamed protein product [Prorocentrum cordatum]|uniref:Protein S-acyltransferase n=1 Tax=Prorocentrum cordatum TaxID=2364126 RepID=A0ABN9VTT3_9DINO|nr:unnamed protein product [Polarella glacialis]CAK0875749.1 unnamed protein product [Polarella glacialis]